MRVADSLKYSQLIESRNRNKEGRMRDFTLMDQKVLAYFSTLCNIDGGQGITCQPKHITVTHRAPLRPIPPLRPSNSAKSYAVFAALSPRKRWGRRTSFLSALQGGTS